MATTLPEYLAVNPSSDGYYESAYKPDRMGNNANIAYGGWTLAVAINAAFQTVPQGYYLYSAQGNFLGPALTDRTYILHVQTYRQTKTFATRNVEVNQRQDNGSLRLCMVLLADFHVEEPASLLEYSRSATQVYSSPKDSLPAETIRESFVKKGEITPEVAQVHAENFRLSTLFWESRLAPEGVGAQTLIGIAKKARTTQDDRNLVDKTSADWFRSKQTLKSAAENAVALAWMLDAAIAFMPLTHNKMFLDDAEACSTLDFSLRLLINHIDVSQWHMRELRTTAGGSARTFSECQVWNESGKMVASMTQQNILRPKL